MELRFIHAGMFKLDGGAMYGVVPKTLWNRYNPADENNRCSWAMRCLLVSSGNRLILIDTGMGDKQDLKFMNIFEPHGEQSLLGSLNDAGISASDITDVLLTHLHFDHVGGAIKREGDKLLPTFPNAKYWSAKDHWNWALNPNPKEKASFLQENIQPIQDSGQLNFLNDGDSLIEGLKVHFVYGHTEAMMIPEITTADQTYLYMADLIPSASHIPIPWVMSYDVRPLHTLKEKERFLQMADKKDAVLLFEHDPVIAGCTLSKTEKGYRMGDEILNFEF